MNQNKESPVKSHKVEIYNFLKQIMQALKANQYRKV